MNRVFCNSTGVALRLYLHQNDPKASIAAPSIIRQILDGGGVVVSSIESAHCVLIFDQNEENAINLQKAIAESEQQIPVLNSDWIAICLTRGHMLGPRWKPEWGGHRVKYCPKVEEFFDESENIKEEDPECKIVVIDLTLSEDEDEENSLRRLNTEPDGQIFTRARGRPEDQRTAAQILSIISKKTAKYKIEDLALLVKELANTARGSFRATFKDLAATYRAEGKDYGVKYGSWANLFSRNQEDYQVCIRKLRQGDISLDNLLPSTINLNNTGIPNPPPNPSPSAAAESETCAESPKARGNPSAAVGPAQTSSASQSTSYSLSYRSLVGISGSSGPAKRPFSAIDHVGVEAINGQDPANKRLRQ